MLVWIASFPGSLDVVLLEYLHRRHGISWYEADLLDQTNLTPDRLRPGQKSARGSWRRVYESSLDSDRLVLARTSFPPSDDLPFVYLSRNGTDQLRDLHHHYLRGNPDFSLASLILGHYQVGDWTSNFESWKLRPNSDNGKFLKIEDFLSDEPAFRESLASILGKLEEKPFGPDAKDPRQAVRDRTLLPAWSPKDAWLYRLIHGDSALDRGYSLPDVDDSDQDLHVATDAVMKFVHQHRASIKLVGQMHAMAGYMDSLKAQLAEETGRLRDYIEILKDENARLKIPQGK